MGDFIDGNKSTKNKKGIVYTPTFHDYDDTFKRDEIPAMRQDQEAVDMSVPERIVLSAGYDGDDNISDANRVPSDIFNEQAMPATDDSMIGMRPPPSTLTVDDSVNFYERPGAGSGRTSDGDGSDRVRSPYRVQVGHHNLVQMEEDRSSDEEMIADRAVVIGNENEHFQSQANRGDVFSRMQRKINMLERALDEYQSRSNVWTLALIAMTIVNPLIVTYLFNRAK